MILKVKVKPNSEKQEIVDFGDNKFLVYLGSKAEDNIANIELIKLFSKRFAVPFNRVKIISGLSSREKLIEIR